MLIFSWFSIAEKFESKQREYSKMHITKMKQMDKNELLSMTDHWARQIQSVAFDATKQILMIQISSVTITSTRIQSVRFCFPWFRVKSANDQNKEVTKLLEPSSGLIFKECDIKGITFNNFILFYSKM